MTTSLPPVYPQQATCKCCGNPASLFGVVDFHKNCEIYRRKVLDLSGVPIYYYRCPSCHFMFTTALDGFTKEDFQNVVYNEEYVLVDPDYQEARPRQNAGVIAGLFPSVRPNRLLDYGGGGGLLSELLRDSGFPQVETYDPFVPRFSQRPTGRFDCVVCFEVVEHATDPARVFADLNALVTDSGLILLSTLLQPQDIELQGVNWWYAGPRNGHVSLFSRASLETLVHPYRLHLASFNDGMHLLFRQIPEFARHLFQS